MCPLGKNASPTTQLAQQPSTLRTNCRPNDGRTKKYKKVDLHFMHDSRTWRQRMGVKTLSHPPTLLVCFQSWAFLKRNCVISMWRNDTKCLCMFIFPLKNFACKGLTNQCQILWCTNLIKLLFTSARQQVTATWLWRNHYVWVWTSGAICSYIPHLPVYFFLWWPFMKIIKKLCFHSQTLGFGSRSVDFVHFVFYVAHIDSNTPGAKLGTQYEDAVLPVQGFLL